MQNNVIVINKKVGETPLECIQNVRKNDPNLNNLPITYAGRLDPLAEGLVILLIGDEVYKKDEYLNLPKEYELDILFGFATDTYDLMGLVIKSNDIKKLFNKHTKLANELPERSSDDGEGSRCQTISNSSFTSSTLEIVKILPNFIGKIDQKYPKYSSRTVNGKPLFMWARDGKINEIDIPSHKVNIENIEIIKESEILGSKLLEKIEDNIGRVKGDFRQKEILEIWHQYLDNNNEKFKLLKIRVSCGSGVYVRVLANDIGKSLGVPALALHIKRTKIGKFSLK